MWLCARVARCFKRENRNIITLVFFINLNFLSYEKKIYEYVAYGGILPCRHKHVRVL